MRTVQGQWEDYERKCISGEASAAQRQEMERAFFAGAHAALHLMYEISNNEALSESAQAALLGELYHETAQYGRDVGEGTR